MGLTTSSQPGGFRVLKVDPDSPAEKANLEIFFDYIVEANGHDFTFYQPQNNDMFAKILQGDDSLLQLIVYNTRTRIFRDSYIKLEKKGDKKYLGAAVQFEPFSNAVTQGVRVLAVHHNSPAEEAGLSSYKDYLISSDKGPITSYEELYALAIKNLDKPMTLIVYNSNDEKIRTIMVKPNYTWGGTTSLGCDVAVGYLNQIPLSRSASISDIDIIKKTPRNIEISALEQLASKMGFQSKMSSEVKPIQPDSIMQELAKDDFDSDNQLPKPILDPQNGSNKKDENYTTSIGASSSFGNSEINTISTPDIETNTQDKFEDPQIPMPLYNEHKMNEPTQKSNIGGSNQGLEEIECSAGSIDDNKTSDNLPITSKVLSTSLPAKDIQIVEESTPHEQALNA